MPRWLVYHIVCHRDYSPVYALPHQLVSSSLHSTQLLHPPNLSHDYRPNRHVAAHIPLPAPIAAHLCPGPLHCGRDASADSSLPSSTSTCCQTAAVLRSPPIPPKPRPTTYTLLTTRDPTEPLCSGPSFPAQITAWRCSRAALSFTWVGWLPRQRHRSILDTAFPSRASRIHPPPSPNASLTISRPRTHHQLPSLPTSATSTIGKQQPLPRPRPAIWR